MDEKYDQTTEAGRNEYAEGVPRDLKFQKIVKACEDKDLESLIDLATSKYGLLEDGYRRRACKIVRHTRVRGLVAHHEAQGLSSWAA